MTIEEQSHSPRTSHFTFLEWSCVILITATALSIIVNYFPSALQERPGDLIVYWSNLRVFMAEQIPVSRDLVGLVSSEQQGITRVDRIVSAPHTAVLLFPILILPFSLSKVGFDIVALVAVLTGAYFAVKGHGTASIQLLARMLFSLLLFTPFIHAIAVRQVSFLLLYAVILLQISLCTRNEKERALAYGAALVLALVKPHLVIAPAVLVLCILYCDRSRGALLKGSAFLATYILAIEVTFPGIWSDWLHFIGLRPANDSSSLLKMLPCSLTYLVYEGLQLIGLPHGGEMRGLVLSLWGLSIIAAVFAALSPRIPVQDRVPVATVIGCVFLPYGWQSDLIILLPLYLRSLEVWIVHPGVASWRHYIVLVLNGLSMLYLWHAESNSDGFYTAPLILFGYFLTRPSCSIELKPSTSRGSLPATYP